jgi:hypothetical protein
MVPSMSFLIQTEALLTIKHQVVVKNLLATRYRSCSFQSIIVVSHFNPYREVQKLTKNQQVSQISCCINESSHTIRDLLRAMASCIQYVVYILQRHRGVLEDLSLYFLVFIFFFFWEDKCKKTQVESNINININVNLNK